MEELCCRGGRARRCEDPDAAHLRAPLLAMPVSCAIMPVIMRIMPARGERGERGERRGARDSAVVQVTRATVKILARPRNAIISHLSKELQGFWRGRALRQNGQQFQPQLQRP